MSTANNSLTKSNRVNGNNAISLVLVSAVLAQVSMMTVSAEVVSAQSVGPDQDSLLPPDVVPFDSSNASQMAQNQAAARSQQMSMGADSSLNSQPTSMQGMQSPAQYKKAMFDSLTGQPQGNFNGVPGLQQGGPLLTGNNPGSSDFQVPKGLSQQPMQQPFGQQQQPQYGQPMANSGQSNQPMGQSPWITPGGQPAQVANNGQSQTLTGGVQNPQMGNSIRKSNGMGIAHGLSMVSLLGMGLGAGLMCRSSGSAFGMGLMGMSLMNYGMRSGLSRF